MDTIPHLTNITDTGDAAAEARQCCSVFDGTIIETRFYPARFHGHYHDHSRDGSLVKDVRLLGSDAT